MIQSLHRTAQRMSAQGEVGGMSNTALYKKKFDFEGSPVLFDLECCCFLIMCMKHGQMFQCRGRMHAAAYAHPCMERLYTSQYEACAHKPNSACTKPQSTFHYSSAELKWRSKQGPIKQGRWATQRADLPRLDPTPPLTPTLHPFHNFAFI